MRPSAPGSARPRSRNPAFSEVVVLEPREGAGIVGGAFAAGAVVVDRGERVLPPRPGAGVARLDRSGRPRTAAGCRRAIRSSRSSSGIRSDEARPDVGPELAGAAAVEPLELGLRHQEDAAQDEVAHPVGMGLRVDQGERRAPAAAEDDPAVDAERLADALDVGDEVPGRVRLDARMGPRPAAAALVEQHDAVERPGRSSAASRGCSRRRGRRAAPPPARRPGAPHCST